MSRSSALNINLTANSEPWIFKLGLFSLAAVSLLICGGWALLGLPILLLLWQRTACLPVDSVEIHAEGYSLTLAQQPSFTVQLLPTTFVSNSVCILHCRAIDTGKVYFIPVFKQKIPRQHYRQLMTHLTVTDL